MTWFRYERKKIQFWTLFFSYTCILHVFFRLLYYIWRNSFFPPKFKPFCSSFPYCLRASPEGRREIVDSDEHLTYFSGGPYFQVSLLFSFFSSSIWRLLFEWVFFIYFVLLLLKFTLLMRFVIWFGILKWKKYVSMTLILFVGLLQFLSKSEDQKYIFLYHYNCFLCLIHSFESRFWITAYEGYMFRAKWFVKIQVFFIFRNECHRTRNSTGFVTFFR